MQPPFHAPPEDRRRVRIASLEIDGIKVDIYAPHKPNHNYLCISDTTHPKSGIKKFGVNPIVNPMFDGIDPTYPKLREFIRAYHNLRS